MIYRTGASLGARIHKIRRSYSIVAMSFALAGIAPVHAAPPTKTNVLDHMAIQVMDLDKSFTFYKRLFGFGGDAGPVRRNPLAELGGGGIMLHIDGNRTAPSEHSRWDHIAITCGDMDAMIAKLDAQHIPWIDMAGRHTPQVQPGGVKQLFIQDPMAIGSRSTTP